MTNASLKKVFYNRVRRTCLKHGIKIVLEGAPKNYRSVQLFKDGQILIGDYAQGRAPLDIDWQKLHKGLTNYGFAGGVQ